MNIWAIVLVLAGGLTACTHLDCKVDDVVVKTVAVSVARELSCTAKLEILDDVTDLAEHDCKKRQELLDALPTGAYSGHQQDCLILGQEVAKMTAAGAPSNWACAGTDKTLDFSKLCAGKEFE